MLDVISVDLSEWLGRRWPPFPATASDTGGCEAFVTVEGGMVVAGYVDGTGWSLRIIDN
ncbi:hypothetical protein [Paraconexibacter sp. AEG42_29]|uniref:hypothetical protein n=1 Tax=Paraconexibacter sp. AEG42_29 TaxID=2997339 RepID=UPI00339D8DCB